MIGTEVPASTDRRKRREGEERTEGPISAGRRWMPRFEAELLLGAMTRRTTRGSPDQPVRGAGRVGPGYREGGFPPGNQAAREGTGPRRPQTTRALEGSSDRTSEVDRKLAAVLSGRREAEGKRGSSEPPWGEANLSWCARIEEREAFGSPS